MSIIITEGAAKEIRRVIDDQGLGEGMMLRVAVTSGGCSGFSYALGFDDEKDESDVISEQHGLLVVMDERMEPFLAGTTIDFKDKLNGRGFTFNNPNAARSCGCQKSFTPKEGVEPPPTSGCGSCPSNG